MSRSPPVDILHPVAATDDGQRARIEEAWVTQRVLITRELAGDAAERLRAAGFEVDPAEGAAALPRSALLQRVRGASALLCTLSERIDGELLDAAGASLRVVANYAVGFDNIDVAACRARGIRATNTPDVLTEATADVAWTLILAAARRVPEGERLVRSGKWNGASPTLLLGVELCGATLGIVGAGRIGSATARRASGFRMRVVYAHPRENAELNAAGAVRLELDELLRQADVVSLHAPMRPENRHLLDRRRLGLLKPTAILVNTARGALIDEAALVEVLTEKRIFAAGLDVFEHEPRLAPGLAELDNVVLLPHVGSATLATRAKMAAMAAENIIAVLQGREPPNAIESLSGTRPCCDR